MSSAVLGEDLEKLWPLIGDGASDSATFDNALELLVAGGYSLAQAMMMMIPEAWNNNRSMDPSRKAFYEYNAALMEPWMDPLLSPSPMVNKLVQRWIATVYGQLGIL